jgi:hypothetical protein
MNDNPYRRDFLRGSAAAAVGADFLCVIIFDFHGADNAPLVKKVLGEALSRSRPWLARGFAREQRQANVCVLAPGAEIPADAAQVMPPHC